MNDVRLLALYAKAFLHLLTLVKPNQVAKVLGIDPGKVKELRQKAEHLQRSA